MDNEAEGYVDPLDAAIGSANKLVEHYEDLIDRRLEVMVRRLRVLADEFLRETGQYANIRILQKKPGHISWGVFKPFIPEARKKKHQGEKVKPWIRHLNKGKRYAHHYPPDTLWGFAVTKDHWTLICELEEEAAALRKFRSLAVRARTWLNKLEKESESPTKFSLNTLLEKLPRKRLRKDPDATTAPPPHQV